MPARTARQAVDEFLQPLQQAISCISHAVILRGAGEGDNRSFMTLSDRWVPLRGRNPLQLSLLHTYTVTEGEGGWVVRSAGYSYQIRDEAEREIIAYHWDPEGLGVPHPHLHLRRLTAPIDLSKCHIPTGRVSLEAVVRFLIAELGVTPLREDWQPLLERNEREFVQKRTWA